MGDTNDSSSSIFIGGGLGAVVLTVVGVGVGTAVVGGVWAQAAAPPRTAIAKMSPARMIFFPKINSILGSAAQLHALDFGPTVFNAELQLRRAGPRSNVRCVPFRALSLPHV